MNNKKKQEDERDIRRNGKRDDFYFILLSYSCRPKQTEEMNTEDDYSENDNAGECSIF